MFKILGVLLLGVLVGRLFKSKTLIKSYVSNSIMLVIYALLFLLGVSIGKNEVILESLHTLGIQAWWLSFGAILGSVIMAKIVFVKFFKAETDER